MRKILCVMLLLTLAACNKPGSKLVGKWSVDYASDNFFGTGINKTKPLIEFTTDEIIKNGRHEPIEMVNQGGDVIVYQTILGMRVGTTYKFINNDTVEAGSFDKQTLHRMN